MVSTPNQISNAAGSIETAKDAAAGVVRDVRKNGEEFAASAKDSISTAKDAVKETAQDLAGQVYEAGSNAAEKISQSAQDATSALEDEIKRSPFLAVGLAFAVGALFAGLVRRA